MIQVLNWNKEKILRKIKEDKLVGAPLAGVTDNAFRKLVRHFFDGLIFTEMISVEGIVRKIKGTMKYIELNENDNPIFIQLFGSKPQSFYEAIKICEDYSCADGYDLNAGCPVKKVLKSNAGSYLLTNLNLFKDIIASMRKATDKPISVKTRLGWDKNSLVYKEILKICENEGVDILTIHARTKSELFSGDIHLDALKELVMLKNSILLIGNGNVDSPQKFKQMLETGVDAVMIGRAMMRHPWALASIKENKDTFEYLSLAEKKSLIYKLYEEEKNYKSKPLEFVKKFAIWFLKGYPNSSEFRKEVYRVKDEKDFIKLMEDFFE